MASPDRLLGSGRLIGTRSIPGGRLLSPNQIPRFSFQLEGVAQLQNALARMGRNLAARALGQALIEAAEILKGAMVASAPVGPAYRSEPKIRRPFHLRESIRRTKPMINAMRREAVIRVGPHNNAFWGLFQEYGTLGPTGRGFTSPKSRFSSGDASNTLGFPGHPPYPWMQPAFDQSERQMKASIERQLNRLIQSAVIGASTAPRFPAGLLPAAAPLLPGG